MTRTRVHIIGGGMAGVSLGSELAVDHDVVVLEAESTLAQHSTGRSAALFLQGYGPDSVRVLTGASEPEFQRLASLPDVPPLLTARGALLTAWDQATAAGLTAQLGRDPWLREVSRREVARLCPVLRTDQLVLAAHDPIARDIDVMALHAAYVRLLRDRGGRTETGVPVRRAVRDLGGWAITTADGRRWHGDVVVNAAGAWGDRVAELCGVSGHQLVPCRRTVVIAASKAASDPRWPVVADAAEAWYFKPEGDALLVSPADERPDVPGDCRPDPLDIALALERVNAVSTLGLRSVRTAWAGLRTFAPDRVPVVGSHPDEPTLFCFLGQGGYGIQMAPALARAGAELLRTGNLADPVLAAALDPGRARESLARH